MATWEWEWENKKEEEKQNDELSIAKAIYRAIYVDVKCILSISNLMNWARVARYAVHGCRYVCSVRTAIRLYGVHHILYISCIVSPYQIALVCDKFFPLSKTQFTLPATDSDCGMCSVCITINSSSSSILKPTKRVSVCDKTHWEVFVLRGSLTCNMG